MTISEEIEKLKNDIFMLEMKDIWDFDDKIHMREMEDRLKKLKEEQAHEGKTV